MSSAAIATMSRGTCATTIARTSRTTSDCNDRRPGRREVVVCGFDIDDGTIVRRRSMTPGETGVGAVGRHRSRRMIRCQRRTRRRHLRRHRAGMGVGTSRVRHRRMSCQRSAIREFGHRDDGCIVRGVRRARSIRLAVRVRRRRRSAPPAPPARGAKNAIATRLLRVLLPLHRRSLHPLALCRRRAMSSSPILFHRIVGFGVAWPCRR